MSESIHQHQCTWHSNTRGPPQSEHFGTSSSWRNWQNLGPQGSIFLKQRIQDWFPWRIHATNGIFTVIHMKCLIFDGFMVDKYTSPIDPTGLNMIEHQKQIQTYHAQTELFCCQGCDAVMLSSWDLGGSRHGTAWHHLTLFRTDSVWFGNINVKRKSQSFLFSLQNSLVFFDAKHTGQIR